MLCISEKRSKEEKKQRKAPTETNKKENKGKPNLEIEIDMTLKGQVFFFYCAVQRQLLVYVCKLTIDNYIIKLCYYGKICYGVFL